MSLGGACRAPSRRACIGGTPRRRSVRRGVRRDGWWSIAWGVRWSVPAAPSLLAALLALAGVTSPALAALGRIEGIVVDARTRQPLEGANITLPGTTRGAATVEDGSFFVPDLAPGTYQVLASFIGYRPAIRTDIVVTSSAPARVEIELVSAALVTEGITVRPRFFAEQRQAPVSTTSLSREEVRRFPGGFEDVVRTVTTLPGVAVVNEGGRNDVLVRGGGPTENLYLVQGLEVPNINHFGLPGATTGSLSFVNLDFVDRVEFSTGGFGVGFGDRMSSVLALDLRPGRSDRFGGKATVSASQFGLNVEGPLGPDGTLRASARRSYLDLIFKAAGQAFVPVYSDYNLFYDARLSPRDRLSVLGLVAADDVERERETAEDRRQNAGILGNEQDRLILGMRLRHLVPAGYVQASLGFNRDDFRFSQADTAVVAREYFRSSSVAREGTVRLDGLLRLRNVADLAGGVSYKLLRETNRASFADTVLDRSGREVSRDSLGLPARLDEALSGGRAAGWLEAERSVARRVSLTAGLRADHYEELESGVFLSPRGALTFRPEDAWTIRLAAGRYRQPPSLVWLLNPANRKLRASRNDMAVAAVEWLVRPDTEIMAELYYKRYRDLPAGIDSGTDSTAATDYLVLTNAGVGYGGRDDDFQSLGYLRLASRGKGEAFGFELQAQKKFSEVPCYGQIGLSVGKSGYRAVDGRWYPGQFDQRIIVSIGGGYVLNAAWEFSAKFRVASGAPYTPVYDPARNPLRPGTVQNLPEEYLSERLGVSHQLDVRADRRWNFESWSMIAFLDVQNVYNFASPTRPRWDFAEGKVESRNSIALLPSVGLTAEF